MNILSEVGGMNRLKTCRNLYIHTLNIQKRSARNAGELAILGDS